MNCPIGSEVDLEESSHIKSLSDRPCDRPTDSRDKVSDMNTLVDSL